MQAAEEEGRGVMGGARDGIRVSGWGDRQRVKNPQDATYKVLSLGMWLKLATDSRLMLLLLSVLRRAQNTDPLDRKQVLCADLCCRIGWLAA